MIKTSFSEQVIVLTGASSGIGRELALQLARQGAFLALASRNSEKLSQLAKECEQLNGKALAIPTDVSRPQDCAALIQKTVNAYKRLDILINNAGLTMYGNFEDIKDIEMFETLIKVNYLGSVYCTHYALPYLKQSRGRIVGISSLTGKNGVPTRTGYAASKHAMAGFFDSLRIELAGSGVTVTMIYPGFVATEMRERALGVDGKPIGKSHLDEGNVMPVERCAGMILTAVEKRKRELIMGFRGKIGQWLKLIAPGLTDRIARKSIMTGRA
ncbi:MAG: SDR family oxidoreductase [Bacteroidota bacterium]